MNAAGPALTSSTSSVMAPFSRIVAAKTLLG